MAEDAEQVQNIRQSESRLADSQPVFASGKKLHGQTNQVITITGDARLSQGQLVIEGDVIRHDAQTQTLEVQGRARIRQQGNYYEGKSLQLNLGNRQGQFDDLSFELDNGGRGKADVVKFLGPERSVAQGVSYSTCAMPRQNKSWMPDWVLKASSIDFDRESDVGTAWGSVVMFKGLPIMASPWMSFPLSGMRKSGFLPMGVNLSDTSGLELVQPYYLNLAPNYDATVYPQILSKRGVNWGGEFRYLFATSRGQWRGDWMSNDRLSPGDGRYALSWRHEQSLQLDDRSWDLNLNLSRVSDDNYWRDFPRSISELTQRQLPADVEASTRGVDWTFSIGSHQWQTLQQPDTITAAYDRVPHAVVDWRPLTAQDYGLSMHSELTKFEAARSDAENGWRWLGRVNLRRRWNWGPGFLEPAVRLQTRHYRAEQSFQRMGNWQGKDKATVVVPTASLGAGLAFERDLQSGGLQTLEPRLLLAFTPSVDQRGLPIYDVAQKDFNLSSVFSPFEYSGSDRVADNRSITWGVTSRWLTPQGGEWLSVSWAQKQRFQALTVTDSDGQALPSGLSDWLLESNWRYNDHWGAKVGAQYDLGIRRVRRSTGTLRYNNGPFRTVQLAYSFQRDSSEMLDGSWQWPLNDLWGDRGRLAEKGGNLGAPRWYGVGRLNYSLRERKLVDAIVGVEYDAGCWMSRIAIERVQNSTTTASHRLFFQLELTGLGQLGSSPLQTLQDNVPYYQVLRRDVVAPSLYENHQ